MNVARDEVALARRWSELLPEALKAHVSLNTGLETDAATIPALVIDGIELPLRPSAWGAPPASDTDEHDAAWNAIRTVVQGRAPDYWRESDDILVQALGWLDRRVGKRSWQRSMEETHERGSLEKQCKALRENAEEWFAVPEHVTQPAPSRPRPG